MKINKLLGLTALSCILTPLAAASAQESFSPHISGEIGFEIQDDWAYQSDDEDSEVNTLSTTIEPYISLHLTKQIAIETSLVFEPVQDTDHGDDTYFENEGMFAEEIKLTYTGENFGLFAGKYNPTFGMAWDAAPGIYGTDFAEDYETTERIGFGGSYTIGDDQTGEHTITANTFFADTTILSESTITKRGNTDEEDGGLSNTEDFSSYSVTWDSADFAGFKGLNTHIGYRNQAEGSADIGLDRERGYAIGANYSFPVTDNVEAMVLGEWVGLRNSAGTDDDMDYLTGSLGLEIYENWNLALSYTKRDTNVDDGDDVKDHLLQLSGGYTFDNGISFDVGYLNTEEDEVETHSLGALLAYTYEF